MGARAVLIAAVASGQGKTTVTAALARKLVRAGRRVLRQRGLPRRPHVRPGVRGERSGVPHGLPGREAGRCRKLRCVHELHADLLRGGVGDAEDAAERLSGG